MEKQEDNIFSVKVPPNQSRERLDKFLTRFIGSVSRARLQKAIAEDLILVNGTPAKASHLVVPEEKIEVCIPKPKPVDILAEDIPLDISYEDEHLLVVNKAAGMVVHPAVGNYSGTLVNALMRHCGDLSSVGGRKRPGIVHRLDKDTSGALVVAKDDATHQGLSAQFKAKTTKRIYVAICWHTFDKIQGRVETYLARSPRDRRRITVQPTGKLAITNYQVLKTSRGFSFMQLQLETGRTHQIRVHLSYLGHPILGDQEYGGRNRQLGGLTKKDFPFAAEVLEAMPRQALHAKTLGFVHPVTEETVLIETAIPKDMQVVLEKLRFDSQKQSV